MSDIQQATNKALQKARTAFQENKGIPSSLGFTKIQGLDGRKKEAKYFKERDGFSVQTNTSDHISAPVGTTVKISEITSQSMERSRKAYQAFIESMQQDGFFEDQDVSVYTRMD